MNKRIIVALAAVWLFLPTGLGLGADQDTKAEVKNLTVNGQLDEGKARLVIEALLRGMPDEREKPLVAATAYHAIHTTLEKLHHSIRLQVEVIRGEAKEIPLALSGLGEIRAVTGEALQDWSIRQDAAGARSLVLRLKKTEQPVKSLTVIITAETELDSVPVSVTPLGISTMPAALFQGYARVDSESGLQSEAVNPAGLVPLEPQFLPEELRTPPKGAGGDPLAFRFQGTAYSLPLKIGHADPESLQIVLRDFKLVGQMEEEDAVFTLTAKALARHPKGGTLDLLSGGVALSDWSETPGSRLKFDQDRFIWRTDKPGEYPLQLKFNAAVKRVEGWNTIEFRVAPAALQPLVLKGLKEDCQFRFEGAGKPERSGADFASYLPANGAVKLLWKEAPREAEGRLFFSAEMLTQLAVSPGLMRQTAWLDFKVMQGELTQVTLKLTGEGEVTRVQGTNVLAWAVEPVAGRAGRRVVVQLNQPQKQRFGFQVQMQASLSAFPRAVDAIQLQPEGATRLAGYFRLVNDGAVRLEVVQSAGMSQIAPELFPETELTKVMLPPQSGQRFVFRFSGMDYQLRLQADNVLPELAVSEVLVYHLGETELTLDAEIELDVREAPVRELSLLAPKGFAVARLTASGLSDYFLRTPEETDQAQAELRLVYEKPVIGRQIIQLRLERNKPHDEASWALPRLAVLKAKSVRGHVGVSADAGFRLTLAASEGLTEVATAFFPRKVPGIQAALRLSEDSWRATLNVERLPQSVQADVLHLFSIGERIAYGSSVINYMVSGAPISTFKLDLTNEYFRVEFTGKDVRSWQKTGTGYQVQLHSPVSGAYTLLATYERPFKGQGERLSFTGVRPLDAQSEQGHTLVVSAYQFQVKAVSVSPGLTALEPGEVPPEYRLFFDAPILAAYRYTARPFNLQLELSPLAQGDTLGQVVDRASLTTRISKEGQVLTDARYFVKNRGTPHFRVQLPEGTQLWSATVNSASVVPVTEGRVNLVPLPARSDAQALSQVDLKLAMRSGSPTRVALTAPIVAAPVLLAEWRIEPDAGRRLTYSSGTLAPAAGLVDVSGFAGLGALFRGPNGGDAVSRLVLALALLGLGVGIWRWSSQPGAVRFSARHVTGALVGLVASVVGVGALLSLTELALREHRSAPENVTLVAPVQQSGSAMSVVVFNGEAKASVGGSTAQGWPALLALVAWCSGVLTSRRWLRPVGKAVGWLLLIWATLRWPNGAPGFFVALLAFFLLHLVVPAFWRLSRVPPRPKSPPPDNQAAPAVATAALVGLLLGAQSDAMGQTSRPGLHREPPLAESVIQEISVQEDSATAVVRVRWQAVKDQVLPVLYEPGMLTSASFPTNSLRWAYPSTGQRRNHLLLALESGTFEITARYRVRVVQKNGQSGFALPTHFGLVNRVTVSLAELDVDVIAPQAVSVHRASLADGKGTTAALVLAPVQDPWIGWQPRSRDTRREKAVFHGELTQLYVPSAGVVEGVHLAQLRPAQGELSELVFTVPKAATITDVADSAPVGADPAARGSLVSLWRFDPDAGQLKVSLHPPQARPFTLLIKSQTATGPLPVDRALGLVSVNGAASQVGLAGVATGPEVQIESATAESLSSINLEDFPSAPVQVLLAQVPGLTLRRAFRYADTAGTIQIKAAAVEPDIRVNTQETLSLGEDRVVLAVTVGIEVTRAGVFRLSFLVPGGMEVESITGPALSHWTELKAAQGRIVTLHLRGKTEGQTQFAITLAGGGVRTAKDWAAPKIVWREASKQAGQMVIVPEQGLKLQVAARDGVTQLDPQRSGVRQKGVLAFRLLQGEWKLTLDVERVDAWVQVTSLQHVAVNEALVKVTANLLYQIENTGLRSLRVTLPAKAESVRFRGEQMADFLAREGATAEGTREWEVKLHRRILGKYDLQVTYHEPVAAQAQEAPVQGVRAEGVNLQRGFLTVVAGGRLQVMPKSLPEALQPTEAQSIPRALRQDLETAGADLAYRLVEPAFQVALQIDRREAAQLLPARVQGLTMSSVIADDGGMLTQARLEMTPGDKRLLELKLPAGAKFWFAFVNRNSVWPWREKDTLLIPLEQPAKTGQTITLEFLYSSQVGAARPRSLDLRLLGPQFDLPLENITWRVYLNEKWRLVHWAGTLQRQDEVVVLPQAAVDEQSYLKNETDQQHEKTREAESLLAFGNDLLQQGDSQQARRAFQAAYGLSTHDDAFNEDARVQLHNLKLQQALVGLNVRQSAVAGDTGAAAGKLQDLRQRKAANFTPDEARQIRSGNTEEDNAALDKLAERLVQQQDAAVVNPAGIRATIPEQGRLLTFTRAIQVDRMADLRIDLQAKAAQRASPGLRLLFLLGTLVVIGLSLWFAKWQAAKPSSQPSPLLTGPQ